MQPLELNQIMLNRSRNRLLKRDGIKRSKPSMIVEIKLSRKRKPFLKSWRETKQQLKVTLNKLFQ
jgi:hypothetical protein